MTKGTEIPRAAGLRAGPFTVSAVGAEDVDLSSVDASGFTSNLLGQRPDQRGPSTVNELSIAVLAIVGDRVHGQERVCRPQRRRDGP
ncbi:hypothetical protein [Streptomyces sp. AC550_RSS872]|uniref:hypothetical protein n=1 Tax=Streptomyces sp. AC550_RSS872 TaxID=2823689 RepID=UPI001C257B53|nr:hypothetical protein [Streptomyces sp. AC550_RSS872]